VSLGKSKPVALNDNDFHRSLNRRVTLRVEGMPSAAAPRTSAPPKQEVLHDVPMVSEPASDSAYTGQSMPQEVAEVEDQAPVEVEIPLVIAPKADKKERAKADKAAGRAANDDVRQAKDAARLKAKQDAEAAKAKTEADKVAQREKEAQTKAAEEARLRRIMDVAAQNKAADEAKKADAKAAAQAASDEAKKSSKPDKKPKDEKGKGGV
jgi:hypothetical protein